MRLRSKKARRPVKVRVIASIGPTALLLLAQCQIGIAVVMFINR